MPPPTFRTIELSDPALEPAGLRFVTVKSAALGRRADLTLWVPPQATGARDLPVVMLLHGVYGSHWAWALRGGAHLVAARLIADGSLPPVVLAMPSDGLWGDGSGYVAHAAHDAERWILDEVPAAAALAVPACSAASPLCVAGLSMGGFGALRLAGKHPQRITAAAALSAITEVAQLDGLIAETRAGWSTDPADQAVLTALRQSPGPLPPLHLACGSDDPLLGANRALHDGLRQAGIAHDYVESPGGHDWAFWSRHLADTLRFFGTALRQRSGHPHTGH